jgi:hypothetical protein
MQPPVSALGHVKMITNPHLIPRSGYSITSTFTSLQKSVRNLCLLKNSTILLYTSYYDNELASSSVSSRGKCLLVWCAEHVYIQNRNSNSLPTGTIYYHHYVVSIPWSYKLEASLMSCDAQQLINGRVVSGNCSQRRELLDSRHQRPVGV